MLCSYPYTSVSFWSLLERHELDASIGADDRGQNAVVAWRLAGGAGLAFLFPIVSGPFSSENPPKMAALEYRP